MKRKSLGFKTELLVKENPDEKIEIDYFQERIVFSGNDWIDLSSITDLQKFRVGYSKVVKTHLFKKDEFGSPVYLNVMAINIPRYDGDFWLFFCDSKKRFCRIAKEFMEAYDLDVTIMRKGKKIVATGRKGYNAKAFFKKAVKTHDARRAFLKFLLYAGKTEWDNFDDDVKNRISGFSVVKEEQLDSKDVVLSRIAGYEEKYIISTKCRFDLPDDFDDKIVPRVEGCFIIDKSEFDTLFEGIGRLLPENKKATKIELEYGENFIRKKEVLEQYRQALFTEKDISLQKQEIQKEIGYWTEQVEKNGIEKDFGENYLSILREKMELFEEQVKIRQEQAYVEARKRGQTGEKEVDYALKWLDKSYITVPKILNKKLGIETIDLYNPGFTDESQEYDHIVIGKQGVFVIETKYYSGTLIIDSNGNWVRIKKDGVHVGERNPFQQMDRHIKLLKSFLQEDVPINGLICMAHPEIIIEGVENSSVPLVKSDLLVKYIENYPAGSDKVLSDFEMRKCLSLIEAHRVQVM